MHVDLIGAYDHLVGKRLGIERRDRQRHRPTDIVGEVHIQVVDQHRQGDRLAGIQSGIEVGGHGDDRHDAPLAQHALRIVGSGVMQDE